MTIKEEQVEEGAIAAIELTESIDTTTAANDQYSIQVSRAAIVAIETIIAADYVDFSERNCVIFVEVEKHLLFWIIDKKVEIALLFLVIEKKFKTVLNLFSVDLQLYF